MTVYRIRYVNPTAGPLYLSEREGWLADPASPAILEFSTRDQALVYVRRFPELRTVLGPDLVIVGTAWDSLLEGLNSELVEG